MKFTFKINMIFLVVGLIGFTSACDEKSNKHRTKAPALAGGAYLSELSGATVNVYTVGADGKNVEPAIASTTTDSSGLFDISTIPAKPFRICVEKGSYKDLASGNTISNSLKLCGLYPANTATTVISLLRDHSKIKSHING